MEISIEKLNGTKLFGNTVIDNLSVLMIFSAYSTMVETASPKVQKL